MPDLTTADAASILGITPDAVKKHCQSGKLPARKTSGGQWLIDSVAVARFARVPRRAGWVKGRPRKK